MPCISLIANPYREKETCTQPLKSNTWDAKLFIKTEDGIIGDYYNHFRI